MTHDIVIADDHQLFRAGLRSLIEDIEGFDVVGEAADGVEAIEQAARLAPRLMLLDITMPRLNGLEALPRVKAASPATRVLVVSMYQSSDFVMQALRDGADGYLLKDAAAMELQLALQALAAGQRYLSPAVSAAVVQHALGQAVVAAAPAVPAPGAAHAPVLPARGPAVASGLPASGSGSASGALGAVPQPAPRPAAEPSPLTPRQIEILRLLASGNAMKQIAYDLGLSVKTVETHRAQLMDRLGIRDLPRLVLYAVRQGLVSVDETAAPCPA